MGKIGFANCQDVRNQKKIRELDCPRCHEPGGIEAFVSFNCLYDFSFWNIFSCTSSAIYF